MYSNKLDESGDESDMWSVSTDGSSLNSISVSLRMHTIHEVDEDEQSNESQGETLHPRLKAFFAAVLIGVMMIYTVRINEPLDDVSGRMTTTTFKSQDSYTHGEHYQQQQQQQEIGEKILDNIKTLVDVADVPFNATAEVPFFLHIPRSGGSTINDILGTCYGLVEATDTGWKQQHHKQKSSLDIVHSDDGAAFVNVDLSTPGGIIEAKTLGLMQDGNRAAEVVVSQYLHHVAGHLFPDDSLKGRVFTMIRHPIERTVSVFHYLGVANWDPNYDPDLAYINMEMYARSKRSEHNWLTRLLSNELHNDLTTHHLEIAKDVLRQKCLVGLLTEKKESLRRFEKVFGWGPKNKEQIECRDRLLHWGWSNKHSHPAVEEGSDVWELLMKKNSLDMELYNYAKTLFLEQSLLMESVESNHNKAKRSRLAKQTQGTAASDPAALVEPKQQQNSMLQVANSVVGNVAGTINPVLGSQNGPLEPVPIAQTNSLVTSTSTSSREVSEAKRTMVAEDVRQGTPLTPSVQVPRGNNGQVVLLRPGVAVSQNFVVPAQNNADSSVKGLRRRS